MKNLSKSFFARASAMRKAVSSSIAISLALFTVFMLYIPMHNIAKQINQNGLSMGLSKNSTSKISVQLFEMYRQCLRDKVEFVDDPETFWPLFDNATQTCSILGLFNHVEVENRDDRKIFLNYSKSRDHSVENHGCTFLTFGVGHDIKLELTYREAFPKCKFIGVDAVDEGNRELYQTIGTFTQTAIASKTGEFTASIYSEGKYVDMKSDAIGIVDYLNNVMNGSHVVDMVSLDIEGAEFGIFNMLSNDGHIQENGYTMCQINLEVHGIYAKVDKSEQRKQWSVDFVKMLLREGQYAIMDSAAYWVHQRLFLVNYKDPACNGLFFNF